MTKKKILDLMYGKVVYVIKENRYRLYYNSVIISFIKLNSNKRNEILRQSSIKTYKIPNDTRRLMYEEELIREYSDIDRIHITAKGIAIVEEERGIIDHEKVIKILDELYFYYPETKKKLSSKEKVILFSLIAVRAFAEQAAMDLQEDTTYNDWGEIFELSRQFLLEQEEISDRDELDFIKKKKGREHPIPWNMVRCNDLPKKTMDIFKYKKGKKRYYLDIEGNEERGITKILGIIFGQNITFDKIEKIIEYTKEIAYSSALRVVTTTRYLDTSYDSIIRKAAEEMIK